MAKKKESKKQEVTVQQFKAWLEGITAFQPDDWIPNKIQWDKIMDKINNLVSDTNNTYRNAPMQPEMRQPQQFAPQVQSPQLPREPIMMQGNAPSTTMVSSKSMPIEGGKMKTPNVDSSTGYVSNFT